MYEESDLVKKTQLQTEQETCSCGCKGQENVDIKKAVKNSYSRENQTNRDVITC